MHSRGVDATASFQYASSVDWGNFARSLALITAFLVPVVCIKTGEEGRTLLKQYFVECFQRWKAQTQYVHA